MSTTAYFSADITPSDSTDVSPGVCSAIYVGVGGDVAIYSLGSSTPVIFKNAVAGQILPLRARRVLATGTTATNLIALYD